MTANDEKDEGNTQEGNATSSSTMADKIRKREQVIISKPKASSSDVATKIARRSSIKHAKK